MMGRRLITTFGLALLFAITIVTAMFALGLGTPKLVKAQEDSTRMGPVYPAGAWSEEQQDVAEAEARGPVDFRIVDVRSEYGQLIVEVEHFDRWGNFAYYELYTWQGREGNVHARATDTDGRLLLSDGTVAPMAVQFGKLEAYLPSGMAWKRETTPQMAIGSILDVIEKTHIQRSERGWDKGRQRLTVRPLDRDTRDDSGVFKLMLAFAGLAGRSYLQPAAEGFNEVDYQGEGGPRDYPDEIAWGTTSTFYPSLDGRLDYSDPSGVAWATIRDASSGTDTGTAGATIGLRMRADGNTNEWDYMGRAMVLFDTSGLPDGDSITAATFGLVGSSGDTPSTSFGSSIGLITSSPASNTALVDADYDNFGTTLQATSINISSIVANDSTYNDWTLNSTGRDYISLDGITKFGIRVSQDITDSEPSWSAGAKSEVFFHGRNESAGGEIRPRLVVTHAAPSAAITGTIGDGATEQEVRDGDGTVIITLTADTWVAEGATFDAQRQAIIDGMDAASSPTNGWNDEVRDKLGVGAVVRTNGTVATITISGTEVAGYRIDANEVITTTVPNAALVTSSGDLTATPTSTITAATESAAVTGTLGGSGGTAAEIVAGGETVIITLTNTKWVPVADFNAQRQAILDGLVSSGAEINGWDAQSFAVGDVVRTSDTVVTITLSAAAGYTVPATETITTTAAANAMVFGAGIVAPETFDIVPSFQTSGTRVSAAIDLSSVTDVAYCAIGWEATTPTNTTVAIATSLDGGSNYSAATNGNCPTGISEGDSLATVTDFRVRATLTTSDTSTTPLITALALIIEDDSGQELYYQLNTTPSTTIEDRSDNSNAGTMSFPLAVSTTSNSSDPLESTASPLTTQQALKADEIVSPVTGAATTPNLFSTEVTGDEGLPGDGIVTAISEAGDGLPKRFVWFIFIGIAIIGVGVLVVHLSGDLMIAAAAMAGMMGVVMALGQGQGLLPGYTLFVFIPLAGSFLLFRRGFPL